MNLLPVREARGLQGRNIFVQLAPPLITACTCMGYADKVCDKERK